MRLVILNQENRVIADYGDMTVEEFEAFKTDALASIKFRVSFPEVCVKNELQLRMLTDTLNKMGMLHGNPEAIQDWMRPYIANELKRIADLERLNDRANGKLAQYRERFWGWVKNLFFEKIAKFFKRKMIQK